MSVRDVEHGDVIVFEFPGQREEIGSPEFMFYLKRAIGLAGDTVQIANRVVYVNGKPSPIPRHMKFNSFHIKPARIADDRIFPKGAPFNEDNWGPVVVPRKGDIIALDATNFDRWKGIARYWKRRERSLSTKFLPSGTPLNTTIFLAWATTGTTVLMDASGDSSPKRTSWGRR
jgi:signal peptidase I